MTYFQGQQHQRKHKKNAAAAVAMGVFVLGGLGMISSTAEGFASIAPPSTSAAALRRARPTTSTTSSSTSLFFMFEQKPGESDIEFIRRITSPGAVEEAAKEKAKAQSLKAHSKFVNGTGSILDDNDEEPSETESPKKTGYQRIEEWDAQRNDRGSMTYEQKLQFDGQRFGNQVRQDSILRRHLGTW